MAQQLVRRPANIGRMLVVTMGTGAAVVAAEHVAQALVNAGQSNVQSAPEVSAALSSYFGQSITIDPAEWTSFLADYPELTEIVLETLARLATPAFLNWLFDLFMP